MKYLYRKNDSVDLQEVSRERAEQLIGKHVLEGGDASSVYMGVYLFTMPDKILVAEIEIIETVSYSKQKGEMK